MKHKEQTYLIQNKRGPFITSYKTAVLIQSRNKNFKQYLVTNQQYLYKEQRTKNKKEEQTSTSRELQTLHFQREHHQKSRYSPLKTKHVCPKTVTQKEE